jgi:Na+/phosphate symporter
MHLVDCVEDPTISILDILTYLDDIKNECKNPNQKILLADAKIKLHKAHFGEKVKSENLNLNINVDYDIEKIKQHLKQFHAHNQTQRDR